MSGIVATLSDADMADAANLYCQQTIRPDSVTNQALASTGERIFFAGAGPGAAPPCAMCHGSAGGQDMGMMGRGMMGRGMMGMMGSGMMANVPNLNGQHAAYIVGQLNLFAAGQRQGTMMNRIAVALSQTEMTAVAAYVSGLPQGVRRICVEPI